MGRTIVFVCYRATFADNNNFTDMAYLNQILQSAAGSTVLT